MRFIKHLLNQVDFGRLPRDQRRIIFYSEGRNYWVHLEGILTELLKRVEVPICYISSSPDDPGLQLEHPALRSYLTDAGWVRNWFFENIDADIIVMTMPDLENHQIKRSKHPVHYVYVHHSLVSSHMAYRPGAFDHFDTVFCAGPHHAAEMKALKQLHGRGPTNLVEHGYGRLDAILAERRAPERRERDSKHILIAPSWGPHGAIETVGDKLVAVLLDSGNQVTLRPHPQTVRLSPGCVKQIGEKYSGHPSFTLETDVSGTRSLFDSDIMISDWSGAAFDYAFGLERPVVFIDVEPKVNNPAYGEINLDPFERAGRNEVGVVCSPSELEDLPDRITPVLAETERWTERIRSYRERSVYNVRSSAIAGAQWLEAALKNGLR
jgi:YidC/Oxa1 family membrane protein insertase